MGTVRWIDKTLKSLYNASIRFINFEDRMTTMKKQIIGILAAVMLIISLTACSSGPDKYLGTYKLSKFKGMDINTAQSLYTAGEGEGNLEDMFVLTLKTGGKAIFKVDGSSQEIDYKIVKNQIELISSDNTLTGTILNGVISFKISTFEIEMSKQ